MDAQIKIIVWLAFMLFAAVVFTAVASFVALEFTTPFHTAVGRAVYAVIAIWVGGVIWRTKL